MSRRASSVPAVEDALLVRLEARIPTAAVMLGLPGAVPDANDRVYILGVQGLQRQPRVEQGARRETYALRILIDCFEPDGSERIRPRDRFWEIVEEIEDELADDPELANIADGSSVEEIVEVNVFPSGDGWLARGLLHVRVLGLV